MIKLKSLILESNLIPIYRGVSECNKKYDNFWTTSKEWARQFTQSGRNFEIKKLMINPDIIYRANPLPNACSDKDFDKIIPEALSKGYKAIWVNEGMGEPNSIYIIDRNKPTI